MPKSAIISIQSEVVYGHVGNSAARFALQRLGFEVWALPTTLLSNHPGHKRFRGEAVPAARLRQLVDGLAENGWLKRCAGILSGYLASPDQADVVADAVAQVKQANPAALFLCDPVFGDDDGAYAAAGVAEAMARRLVPLADIVTPNRFELASLAARSITDAATAVSAAQAIGRREVLATSVPFGPSEIGSLVVTPSVAVVTRTQKLDGVPHGTGDLMSALYLAARLDALPPRAALERAASATHAIILASIAAGSDELALIDAQDNLQNFTHQLSAEIIA